MGVVEYKGSSKSMEGAAMEIYPVGCCYEGCASCCANGMCGKTCGTMYCCAPQFTLTFAEDGGKSGVGKNSNIAGCIPNSPIPCFMCCGVGPLAFQSPFVIVEEDAGNGNEKWCGTMYCCAPQFTLTFAEDGGKSGVGKNSNIAGCIPNSPIPCFVCCGVGPLAFQSPFVIVEEDAGNGNKKWVGSGQVCAGGCCPCMNNKGDWGLNSPETDGSSPDKPHVG